MARVWKPGDVALLRPSSSGSGDWEVAVRVADGWFCSVEFGHRHPDAGLPVDVRPVAVIDPEDREQVERLVRALPLEWNLEQPDDPDLFHESTDQVAAALREFANPKPPKPEEPTGHLAVVEDVDGVRWVNWRDPREGLDSHKRPWQSSAMDTDEWRDYADIAAVRVLSEGVTQ